MTSKPSVSACPRCGTPTRVQKVTLSITTPEDYGVLGFRAVVGIPCDGCGGMCWGIVEVVHKGHQRLYREVWRVALETEDFVPYDWELKGK